MAGCRTDAGSVQGLGAADAQAWAASQYSEWSPAVNAGPVVNSPFNELLSALSPDGLSLYFTSERPGGAGALDIWVSRRSSPDDDWEAPANLGVTINTAALESAPSVSNDGHYLFFASSRPGGLGGNDIWVSHRDDPSDDLGWQPPVNLAADINSAAFEAGACLVMPEFYFTSSRDNAPNLDIFVSRVQGREFGPATRVDELSTPANDQRPAVRFDGREIFSTNHGSPDQNVWTATRQDRGSPWTAPVRLGAAINTEFLDQQPSLSFDGRTLVFTSTRPGGSGGGDLSPRGASPDRWTEWGALSVRRCNVGSGLPVLVDQSHAEQLTCTPSSAPMA